MKRRRLEPAFDVAHLVARPRGEAKQIRDRPGAPGTRPKQDAKKRK